MRILKSLLVYYVKDEMQMETMMKEIFVEVNVVRSFSSTIYDDAINEAVFTSYWRVDCSRF